MKRLLFLFIFVLALSKQGTAQPAFNGQRIKALKVAYITQALNLTADEAQKFWPVYNAYDEEIKKAKQANVDDQLKKEEAVLNIKKKYKPEFKKILVDDVRVNKVFRVDADFVEEVKKELKRRQALRQQGKKAQPTE
jgi:Skp family chaperone for outer membrane proteins